MVDTVVAPNGDTAGIQVVNAAQNGYTDASQVVDTAAADSSQAPLEPESCIRHDPADADSAGPSHGSSSRSTPGGAYSKTDFTVVPEIRNSEQTGIINNLDQGRPLPSCPDEELLEQEAPRPLQVTPVGPSYHTPTHTLPGFHTGNVPYRGSLVQIPAPVYPLSNSVGVAESVSQEHGQEEGGGPLYYTHRRGVGHEDVVINITDYDSVVPLDPKTLCPPHPLNIVPIVCFVLGALMMLAGTILSYSVPSASYALLPIAGIVIVAGVVLTILLCTRMRPQHTDRYRRHLARDLAKKLTALQNLEAWSQGITYGVTDEQIKDVANHTTECETFGELLTQIRTNLQSRGLWITTVDSSTAASTTPYVLGTAASGDMPGYTTQDAVGSHEQTQDDPRVNVSPPPAYSGTVAEQNPVWSPESQSAEMSDLPPPPTYFEAVETGQ